MLFPLRRELGLQRRELGLLIQSSPLDSFTLTGCRWQSISAPRQVLRLRRELGLPRRELGLLRRELGLERRELGLERRDIFLQRREIVLPCGRILQVPVGGQYPPMIIP